MASKTDDSRSQHAEEGPAELRDALRGELHAIYEEAPGFIAMADGPDHRFTFANAAYKKFVGREELVGLSVAEALPWTVEQGFIALLDQVFASGQPFVGTELPISVPDGEGRLRQYHMNFIYQPVRDREGRTIGLFCEGFDVTEQKLARDKVAALQSELIYYSRVNAMETMATTLAHELNQPLTAIGNYTAGARRLIQAGDTGSEQLAEILQMIEESSERAGETIRHLRTLTMRGRSYSERFDLQDVIRKCVKLLKISVCESAEIVDASTPGIMVEADSIQIQQVIINLLRNGCEASVDAGNSRVEIGTSVSGGTVTVTVADSGAGVAAGALRADFQWTPTTKTDGMGVGLSISRTIIDAHGGRLWLESGGPEGSCFAFSLPEAAAEAAD